MFCALWREWHRICVLKAAWCWEVALEAQQYVLPAYFAYARVSVRMQFRTDVLRSGPALGSALLRSLQHSAVGSYTWTGRGTTGCERTYSVTATLFFCTGGKLRAELSKLSERLLYTWRYSICNYILYIVPATVVVTICTVAEVKLPVIFTSSRL